MIIYHLSFPIFSQARVNLNQARVNKKKTNEIKLQNSF